MDDDPAVPTFLSVKRNLIACALRPLADLLFWLLVRGEPQSQCGPFQLIVLSEGVRVAADHQAKLEAALKILGNESPSWYTRVSGRVRLLVIGDHHGQLEAQYYPRWRAVLIRGSAMAKFDPTTVAVMLVHESTHARVHDLGIRHRPSMNRRIERLCLVNEIRFLKQVENSETAIRVKGERLARGEY